MGRIAHPASEKDTASIGTFASSPENITSKAIKKRLAMRPLFLWIAGILIQVYFPCHELSVLLLLPLAVMLALAFCLRPPQSEESRASLLWGFAFSLLLLFVSIQTTEYAILNLDTPLPPSPLRSWAENIQQLLSKRYALLDLSAEGKALLSTLTLGDRSDMPWELKQQFSAAGAAHILAVSGFHVGVVCAFVNGLLSFLPLHGRIGWLRIAMTVGILLSYALITGMSSSTLRATAMALLFFVSMKVERYADSGNLLATSALLMLIYNPLYLFDIGFQLSYAAVFAILYMNTNHLRKFYMFNPLLRIPYQWIMISIAAQMGTLFLCLHHFGSSSLVFLFTNIPVMLCSLLLIPLSIAWLFVPQSFFLADTMQAGVETLTECLLLVVERFGDPRYASFSLRLSALETVLAYIGLAVLLLFLQKRMSKKPPPDLSKRTYS